MKIRHTDLALAAVPLVSFGAVGVALVSQHAFGMLPCPWCILQRVIFLVMGLLCLAALAVRSLIARQGLATLAALAGLSGVASAIYQHEVAAQMFSCNLTLADKIITALNLERILPYVFRIEASCADAAVDLLGLPYEYWSGGLFVILTVVLLVAVSKAAREG